VDEWVLNRTRIQEEEGGNAIPSTTDLGGKWHPPPPVSVL